MMSTPSEDLQHELFPVLIHVAISPLDIIDSCRAISDEVSGSHDNPYSTATYSNHLVINGHLGWHSKPLEIFSRVPKFCLESQCFFQEGESVLL